MRSKRTEGFSPTALLRLQRPLHCGSQSSLLSTHGAFYTCKNFTDVCVHVCVVVCAMACVWMSKKDLQQSVLSYHGCPGN